MDKLKLGQIITEKQSRDAVHIAVVPVTAGERLYPGQHIGVKGGESSRHVPAVGVVDPFLHEPVMKGEKCWIMLYPGSITSLRHDWTHPAFEPEEVGDGENENTNYEHVDSASRFVSQKWLQRFADSIDVDYHELMYHAGDYQENGEYWNEGMKFMNTELPSDFWDHYQIVTGHKVKDTDSFFSCSC